MLKKALLLSLLLTWLPLQAQARNYSVEAIIFNHVVTDDTAVVEWDENAPRNLRAQNSLNRLYLEAREAEQARQEEAELSAQITPVPMETTSAAEESEKIEEQAIETIVINELTELQTIHDRLIQSPDHEILHTLSWQQSEANYRDSPLIPVVTPHMMGVLRVYAPNLLFAELNLLYVPGEILPEYLALEQAEGEDPMLATEPEPEPEVEPLFASINIDGDGDFFTVPEPIEERYFIGEQRKLKLNEIHYFDHPRLGVILNVKPLEDEQPDTASETATQE